MNNFNREKPADIIVNQKAQHLDRDDDEAYNFYIVLKTENDDHRKNQIELLLDGQGIKMPVIPIGIIGMNRQVS